MSAAVRTRPLAPRAPRRVSGPVARPRAGLAGVDSSPSTGALERLRALPDHRLLDRILRGRAWVWLIGLGLMGIVAMQVSLLKLNTGISRAVEATSTLERQNADLEASIARLSSGERIRAAAERNGMVTPPAGELRYLQIRPAQDARRAAARMRPPSQEARELMANGGRVPGALAAVPAATVPAGSVAVPGAEGATIVTPAPATTPASGEATPGAGQPAPGQATPGSGQPAPGAGQPAPGAGQAAPGAAQPGQPAPTPGGTAPGSGGATAAAPAGPQG
jgi:cell division protein FtsL